MKDIIKFPVSGVKHYLLDFDTLGKIQEGTILSLEAEPSNTYDEYAIKVLLNDNLIGYVPNKGYSCRYCYSHRDLDEPLCYTCGATWDAALKGGLAFRLTMVKALNKPYACYVESIKGQTIMAKLVLE